MNNLVKNWWDEHRYLIILIFLVAFSSRLLMSFQEGYREEIQPNESYFKGTSLDYLLMADHITKEHAYYKADSPPGYPLWLSFLRVFGMESYFEIRVAQAVVDAIAAALLFYIALQIGLSRLIAVFAALFYALSEEMVFGANTILGESLSPFAIIMVLAFIVTRHHHDYSYGIISFCLGLFVLSRPDLILLYPYLGIATIWHRWQKGDLKATFQQLLKPTLFLFLGVFFTIGMWASFNRVVNKAWVLTSVNGGNTLWEGLGEIPNDYGYLCNDNFAKKFARKHGYTWHTVESNKFFKAEYRKALWDHPGHVVYATAMRWKQMIFCEGHDFEFRKIGIFLFFLLIPFIYRKHPVFVIIVALPMWYALFSIGLVHYESRYTRYMLITYFLSLAFAVEAIVELGKTYLPKYNELVKWSLVAIFLFVQGVWFLNGALLLHYRGDGIWLLPSSHYKYLPLQNLDSAEPVKDEFLTGKVPYEINFTHQEDNFDPVFQTRYMPLKKRDYVTANIEVIEGSVRVGVFVEGKENWERSMLFEKPGKYQAVIKIKKSKQHTFAVAPYQFRSSSTPFRPMKIQVKISSLRVGK